MVWLSEIARLSRSLKLVKDNWKTLQGDGFFFFLFFVILRTRMVTSSNARYIHFFIYFVWAKWDKWQTLVSVSFLYSVVCSLHFVLGFCALSAVRMLHWTVEFQFNLLIHGKFAWDLLKWFTVWTLIYNAACGWFHPPGGFSRKFTGRLRCPETQNLTV